MWLIQLNFNENSNKRLNLLKNKNARKFEDQIDIQLKVEGWYLYKNIH